jgi:hypothetical protein
MRKTNLTQSRKGAKEKRKNAPRHYRFDPTLDKQVAVLPTCPSAGRPLVFLSSLVTGQTISRLGGLLPWRIVKRGTKKRSGPKVAALSFGSKQIVNGKTLSPRSKDMMRSLICVLDCKTNSYSEKYKRLVTQFRDIVETHLQIVYTEARRREELERLVDERTTSLQVAVAQQIEANDRVLSEISQRKKMEEGQSWLGNYILFHSPLEHGLSGAIMSDP